jgi:monothiol glutaredoxin
VTDQAVTSAAGADPVHAFIGETVKQHDVVLFMKGTPDAPRCGFSSLAVQILDHIGANFVGVDVLQDEALRDGIKTFSDWPTIPQLYVKGEFVGGSDIVREMFNAGELQTLMADKGVALGEDADA